MIYILSRKQSRKQLFVMKNTTQEGTEVRKKAQKEN
jgi:hypothetical protein